MALCKLHVARMLLMIDMCGLLVSRRNGSRHYIFKIFDRVVSAEDVISYMRCWKTISITFDANLRSTIGLLKYVASSQCFIRNVHMLHLPTVK